MFDKILTRNWSRRSFLAGLGAASALPILAACTPQIVTEERVQVVEKDVPVERVVTQIVREQVEKIVTVEVEKAVEVEKVVTVEVEKAVEVERVVTVEVEKEVIVEREKIVTIAPVMMEKKVVTSWGWVHFSTSEDFRKDGQLMGEALLEDTGISEEHIPVDYPRYIDALKASVPAGVGPNVFENNWSVVQPMGREELIVPLQDYASAEWGSDWKNKFVAGPIDEFEKFGQIEGKGNHYHLSVYAQALGFTFVNLDLFEEHDLELPKTWDEYVKVNDTFTAAGVPALAMPMKALWWANSYWTLLLETAAPGYRDQIDWEGTGNFDSDECREALRLYTTIFERNWTQPNPLAVGYQDAVTMFIDKKIAACMGWSGWWGSERAGEAGGHGEQWGIIEPPDGKTLASSAAGWAMTQTADKDLAWDLINWYVDGPGQDFIANRPSPPAKKGVKMGSAFPNFDKNVIAPTMAILNEGRTILRWAKCTATDESLAQGMQGLIDGRTTIDEVLDEAQKVWETRCN